MDWIHSTMILIKNFFLKDLYSILFLLLTFLFFLYFFIFLPQKRKFKNQKHLMYSIKEGDHVILENGLIVFVSKIYQHGYMEVFLNKKIKFVIRNDFVVEILPKGSVKIL